MSDELQSFEMASKSGIAIANVPGRHQSSRVVLLMLICSTVLANAQKIDDSYRLPISNSPIVVLAYRVSLKFTRTT